MGWMMIFRSKKHRVGIFTKTYINILYGLGVKVNNIVKIVGFSRATIFRHIIR